MPKCAKILEPYLGLNGRMYMYILILTGSAQRCCTTWVTHARRPTRGGSLID